MNIMNRVTWKSMWENRTRTIVTIIGIVLSAAMFTAVTTMAFSFWSFLVENEVYNTGDYFLRYDYTSDEHLEELAEDKRISQLGDLKIFGYHSLELDDEDRGYMNTVCAVAAGDRAFYDMVTVRLEEGRLPRTSSELVISRNVYYYLQQGGKGCEVGEIVELEVLPKYTWDYARLPEGVELPTGSETVTKSYTIVGIGELNIWLGDAQLLMSHLLTFADGSEGEALWHRAYVKTVIPSDANVMKGEAPEGTYAETNDGLLEFYGATKYTNYNNLIALIGGVFLIIIMVGSVSLIYNAFAISVAERTKQFGLLASVGATRKQLRRSVYFEALTLSAMGIPIGILCGFGGIALTLELLKRMVNQWISGGDGTVVLRAVPSVWVFLAAGVIAVVTVLLSAWIPARRATKIAPILAIRQTQDYKIPKRGLKVGKLTQKLWGLPGLMAKKYYTVSKKKYRATVVSLTISILLFISATGIVGVFQYLAGNAANTNNFDLQAFNMNQEQIDDLRAQDSVDRTALYGYESFWAVIPKEDQAEDYWEVYEILSSTRGNMSQGVKELRVYYLEDTVLREYLVEQGIDPEPYFDEECPMALVYQPNTTTYREDPETGEWTRYTYKTGLVAEGVESLAVYPEQCPDEVHLYISDLINDYGYEMSPAERMPVYVFAPYEEPSGSGIISFPDSSEDAVRVAVVAEENEAGQTVYAYYLYDAENDKLDDTPICTVEQSEEIPQFRLGAMVEESPFGLNASCGSDVETVTLILPLSAAEDIEKDDLRLSVSINDYDAITAYLTENEIIYDDYLASERQARDIILMVNVFSYGFIILITMISVANVFNTITTNIALRRRDFGMLRSVGMKTGEIYRMMAYECLIYGGKALLWGLPISLLISYGIYMITSGAISEPFMPPWRAIVIAVACVFMIVFITMFYAVTKIRKDNPIDAIRMENT